MEFMDGVTIIKECTEISDIGCIMIIVSLGITTVLSFGAYKISEVFEEKCRDTYKRFFAALALAFFISGTFVTLKKVPDLDVFQELNGKYEVVVNSNVDMNEFQNRYDIINFENGIYTVKPKDNVPQQPVSTQEKSTSEMTTEIDGKIYKITPIE